MSEQHLTVFPSSDDSAVVRSRVRDILQRQLAREAAERARQRLVAFLAALSGVLWLALAKRSLLSDHVVVAALATWAAVFVATVGTLMFERRCRRRQDAALAAARGPKEENDR